MNKLVEKIKYFGFVGFYVSLIFVKFLEYIKYNRLSYKSYLEIEFFRNLGYKLNLDVPITLNEKLQWLKIYDRRIISTVFSDKYLTREFIEKEFGDEFLIPIYLVTDNPTSLKFDHLPSEPFVVKSNISSGNFRIVKDIKNIDFNRLIVDCKWWQSLNCFHPGIRQYMNISPLIFIEKMLQNSKGEIPNDYNLHCINGKVEFISVFIDREGGKIRNFFDPNWVSLDFTYHAKNQQNKESIYVEEIEPPKTLAKMISLAEHIAKMYAYLRVDFFDINSKLYFRDIKNHYGVGAKQFIPIEVDYKYGHLLDLNFVKHNFDK